MIEIKNIFKSFSGQEILKDLTFTYEKGKTNLVIGQSGSGKTVLLKCLLGLYKPEQGSILFDGEDIVTMSNRNLKKLRKEVGMVFQGGALFDSMNIEQNVLFPLQMFSDLSAEEMLDRVNYKVPFGILGRIAHPIIVRPKHEEIFDYRFKKTEELFGKWK